MFIAVAWLGKKGDRAHIVKEMYPVMEGSKPREFSTWEEAKTHCNTELFGWDWTIIDLDVG